MAARVRSKVAMSRGLWIFRCTPSPEAVTLKADVQSGRGVYTPRSISLPTLSGCGSSKGQLLNAGASAGCLKIEAHAIRRLEALRLG